MEYTIENFLVIKNYARSTEGHYRFYLKRFEQWMEGERLTWETLDPVHVVRHCDGLDYPRRGSSRKNVVCCIRAFVRWRFGDNHPCLMLKVRCDMPPPQRTLTDLEIEALYKSFGPTIRGARDRALVSLILDTGARASAAAGLRISDVDFDSGKVNLFCKGGKWRTASITEYTAAALRAWLEVRPYVMGKETHDRLFCSLGGTGSGRWCKGRPMTVNGLRCACYKMAKEAEIQSFGPHALRRTMCTRMLAAGASMRHCQLQGGWDSLEMVARYSRALEVERAREFLPTSTMNVGSVASWRTAE